MRRAIGDFGPDRVSVPILWVNPDGFIKCDPALNPYLTAIAEEEDLLNLLKDAALEARDTDRLGEANPLMAAGADGVISIRSSRIRLMVDAIIFVPRFEAVNKAMLGALSTIAEKYGDFQPGELVRITANEDGDIVIFRAKDQQIEKMITDTMATYGCTREEAIEILERGR